MKQPVNLVVEAPIGTHTILVYKDGSVEAIPIDKQQIDWAVYKINKLKEEKE